MSYNPTEATVACKLIRLGLEAGYTVSIQDGEEWVVKHSSKFGECAGAIGSTDEDRIRFRNKDRTLVGTFYLVWGNSAEELIADHTDNDDCNALYRAVMSHFKF